MWESIKKWGIYFVGALIFLLSIVGAFRGRGKESPVADVDTTKDDVIKQNANAVEIEEKQKEVVAVVTKPINSDASKDINEAIDRFNRT